MRHEYFVTCALCIIIIKDNVIIYDKLHRLSGYAL